MGILIIDRLFGVLFWVSFAEHFFCQSSLTVHNLGLVNEDEMKNSLIPGTGSLFYLATQAFATVAALCSCYGLFSRRQKPRMKMHPTDDRNAREALKYSAFHQETRRLFVFGSRFLLTFWVSIITTLCLHLYSLSLIDRVTNQVDLIYLQLHDVISTMQTNVTSFVDASAALELKSNLNQQTYANKDGPTPLRPAFKEMCMGACWVVSSMKASQLDASSWFFDLNAMLNRTALQDQARQAAENLESEIKTGTDDAERERTDEDAAEVCSSTERRAERRVTAVPWLPRYSGSAVGVK